MSSGALWEDLKIGLPHLRDWKRIALVTDIDWIVQVTELSGRMTRVKCGRFGSASVPRRSRGSWEIDQEPGRPKPHPPNAGRAFT